MISALVFALAAAVDPSASMVSEVTHRPERVGQCFDTRVRSVIARLYSEEGGRRVYDLASGSAATFDDGHMVMAYERLPGIETSRPGDPVRLCVIEVPVDCPKDDHRGIEYRGLNRRTGQTFEAADAEHACGGG